MEDSGGNPKIGQFVKVLRGRDAGKYAIVIGIIDDRYVWIADGNKRKFDHPKKKNILHLELQDEISEEVESSLTQTGRVTNGKLRFAVNQFMEKRMSDAH